jgi:GNAT superfamily N-acetyltransferase
MDWGASLVEVLDGEIVAFALVKKSASSLYKGPDRDTAHLSGIAYSDPLAGVDLLSEVKRVLRNRGIQRVVFGQDSRHFFPGCPTDQRWLSDFLTIEGFQEGDEVVDLERDLTGFASKYPVPEGCTVRELVPDDAPELRRFLEREFPGRWYFDAHAKASAEGIGKTVVGLFEGGELNGFAIIQEGSHRLPIGGAVWRNSLGEDWGALGPIGVSASRRGGGRGYGLLGAALEILAKRGAKQTIIDWTTLMEFYGAHGFVPTRTYRSMILDLGL